MTPNEYQELALSTLVTTNERDTLVMCALGISGESGEVNDVLKKCLWHQMRKPLDANKIQDEAGDLLWYATIMAYQLNIKLEGIVPVLKFGDDTNLAFIGFGLAEAAGDVARFTRMYCIHSQTINLPSITSHLQKLLANITFLAAHIGVSLEDIMQHNIDKLAKRHKANGEATGFNPHYTSDSVKS